ncbi:MAG: hypothetical protein ABFS28_16370 [Bacteroidota bacterium]
MKLNPNILSIGLVLSMGLLLLPSCNTEPANQVQYDLALENGKAANEGLRRCQSYLESWLEHADPVTALIPENLAAGIDRWTPRNSAADNYPFMVLVSALTDSALFHGIMHRMLETETTLTSRIGHLPDDYSFSGQDFVHKEVDVGRIIFGASEYVKDGLMPLTEYLGPSPWADRMIAITDDVWAHAPVGTEFGALPSLNVEVNGEQLQVLSRLYWMTGEQKYLDWAIRLGDYYLLGENHPTRDFEALRLNDHGCEIVSGLCELYASVHFALPEKKAEYQEAIHEMLDRILEVGRNEDGLFYVSVNPKTGEILEDQVRDNWGYNYNGYYSVYLIDGIERYREALLKAFSHLDKYKDYNWESGSADGFADAIEGCLNLYNREPMEGVEEWLDSETRVMWSLQDSSYRSSALQWQNQGIIEGWHGDGNFARTTIMYCLWKSQGTTLAPWREDLVAGAQLEDQTLYLALRAKRQWEGRLVFDTPRSSAYMNMPLDWPRINQFPEWYTVSPSKKYKVSQDNSSSRVYREMYSGEELAKGVPVKLLPDKLLRIEVSEL